MRHKFKLGEIVIGKKIEVPTTQGLITAIVMEANDVYFIAADGRRKFRLSFETGKVKDISEYNYDRDGLIEKGV